MRLILLLCLLPFAATADCRDEIVALFDGGPLDPLVQPPYRYENSVTAADGSPRYRYVVTFDTPMRSMTEMTTGMTTLAIGRNTWTKSRPDGPWIETPSSLPEDLMGFHKHNRDQLAANVSDAECLGVVPLGGEDMTAYRYKTQTGPNDDGTYFGSLNTIYIDPASNRLMRQEQTGNFAHYQPEPGTDLTVMIYTYDPAITLAAPE
ncbi:MAG: hypothetical protein ACI8R4_000544 [Paracoccaceae bacterium]|jgi:hypothetical protein